MEARGRELLCSWGATEREGESGDGGEEEGIEGYAADEKREKEKEEECISEEIQTLHLDFLQHWKQ